jgi:hypothetical protein
MAVDTGTRAGRRRFVYGANVVIQVVLVALVVVGVIYLAQRYKRQADLTRTGINSLGDRTLQLVRHLPEDVRITALYPLIDENLDKYSKKRHDTVNDLLTLYESTSRGKITVAMLDPLKDKLQLPPLLKRLRDKPAYKNQAAEHVKLLGEFEPLRTKIAAFLDEQLRGAEALAAGEGAKPTVISEIRGELTRLRKRGDDAARAIQQLQAEDIPRYAQAVEEARKYLETASSYLQAVADWVQNKAPADRNLKPEGLTYLQALREQSQPLMTEIGAFTPRTQGLKPVELEEISGQLSRWTSAPPILVETNERAQIVPFADVWPYRTEPVPGQQDEHEFAGERAVSSAILKLTQKEKTAVVFTRFGGVSPITPDFSQMNMNMRQMPRAPYGALNDLLGKENFVTQDWDVSKDKQPPQVEDAVRTIYVVFPPAPPPQPDPRRPTPPPPGMTPEDIKLVTGAIEKAGMGVFLVGWQPPEGGQMGLTADSKYDYAQYLTSTWGIDPLFNYVVLGFSPSPDNPQLFIPTQETQRAIIDTPIVSFTSHAIGQPLAATNTAFDVTCPLRTVPSDKLPAGVKIEPVAVVKATSDVWALKDIMRLNQDFRTQKGTFRREDDVAPPFAVVLAAEKSATPTSAPSSAPAAGQRIVVFASQTFVNNSMLEMPGGIMVTGAGLQSYAAYPGNADLFLNALHWLTNDAERISVSAQKAELPRLTRLKNDGWLTFWRVFLVGTWPGLVLVVGGCVWLFRRR